MLTTKTFVVRSLIAFTLSLTTFGADAPKPQAASAKPAACSTTVMSDSGTQLANIDAYGRCVFRCLQAKGSPDFCAQACAKLLQQQPVLENVREEKPRPVADELAELSISE